jgi:hypothetical protein
VIFLYRVGVAQIDLKSNIQVTRQPETDWGSPGKNIGAVL